MSVPIFNPNASAGVGFRTVFGTDFLDSYHLNNGKIQKISEDGFRTTAYPGSKFGYQLPKESHSVYKSNF